MKASATFDKAAFLEGVALSKPFLELAATAETRELAGRIAERARSLAPVGTPEEGDAHPGEMRDDIGIKGQGVDAKGPYVDVGTREPYGLYVEFGTADMAAEPFMRPAIAAETAVGAMSSRVFLAPSTPFKRIRKSRR